jgi:putative tryptophan/tyrosine transport system substrate-binding protein
MGRREFIGLVGGAVAWSLAAKAQEPGRIYRLGFLAGGPRDEQPNFVPMFETLRQSGFIEGQNLIVDWRAFADQVDRVPELAAELVEAKPDVLYASGDFAIRALLRATATVPIVGLTEDMVGSSLVSSLARPDTNLTGVSILSTELDGKRQEILIDAVPGLQRMAALADTNATSALRLQALQDAARSHNVELSLYRVTKPEEIVAAIDAAKTSGAAALNVLASPVLYRTRRIIIERAAELRLPAIYQFPEEAIEGGFAAYGPSFLTLYRDMVTSKFVRLLRGARPADLPVEQPTNFQFVINLKTAKALGLTMPESFLLRADEVIE